MKFRAIGPTISGGRATATAGSNTDAMLYYAGSAAGGVWKSVNGGISWTGVWKTQPLGSIGAVAIDPANNKIVWAGTGEANPRNDLSWGNGIYRTADGAKTWQHMGLDGTSQIARISIDPAHHNEIVVAALGNPWADSAERGIYRTIDGGKTWNKTLYADEATGAADLARDPKDARILYASMWRFRRQPWIAQSGGGRSGLYKSIDGGASFSRITGNGFPAGDVGRIGIGIAPGRPSRVYAVIQAKQGTIWRSDDSGAHWQRVSSNTLPEQRPFYFSHLAVDPHNADHVISVSMYLSESKDGGRTWAHVTDDLHPDNHALWWSSDGRRLLNGNDGGISLSNDSGKSWAMPWNLPIGQIYHVGYNMAEPYSICGGFQDNSTWCGPSNSINGIGTIDRDWYAIAGGDGTWALFDPSNPDKIWTDTQDGVLTIFDRKAQQSIDISPVPGSSGFNSLRSPGDQPYRFNWNSPLAFSPQDPKVAYFGGNVVFLTADDGRTWKTISGDLTRNEKEHQLPSGGSITYDVSGAEFYDTLLTIAPSSKEAGEIWTGSDDGLVQLTRDGGTTWKNVTPAQLPKYARVEAIDLSPADAAVAYIAVDRHDLGDRAPYLFATADYGATWRRIDGGLPRTTSSHVIRLDPKNPQLLYAGTEAGIWQSPDSGASWHPLQFNLPAAPIYDLQIHPRENDLIVATHGRSFWILDDLTPIQQAAAAGDGPYLFPLRPGTNYAQWPPIEGGPNSLPVNFYIGPNPRGPALITFYQKAKAKTRPDIEIVDAAGKTVRHFAGSYTTSEGKKYWVSNAAGYNRLAWDGNEDGPARWTGTSLQNAGPLTGADALPGDYVIRLHVDGKTLDRPFLLKADPRSPFTSAQLVERHAYLSKIYADISTLDTLLNQIDKKVAALKKSSGTAAQGRIAELLGVQASLTANDLHDEDSIGRPDRLRERLFSVAGPLGSSYQPAFAAHLAFAAQVQSEYDATMASARTSVEK